ncbi:chemotaxis protein CheW [Chroococcidiopsis sp. FACHB-1243]|uniref:chemotaxis protein CheW n=1 Tax=Chroococcidiopsis sp. [FACHB-1243] TaxID=2692781 RepID=UPI0017839DA8|nr:chemotaxis protein CheW [Chroococcidiopsis sp. [FACHB-1243]]MBD2307062.1 chemotaxis protein CheW [Chroococcidiopsis sp. [FACHB-1243]]
MTEVQQYCTFFINEIHFGIDIKQVEEVIRVPEITPVPLAPVDICGLINLRGKIVTIIDLQCRLGMGQSLLSSTSDPELDEEFLAHNIIVQTQDEIAGLLVEDIGDMLEFTSDRFESSPATLAGQMRKLLRGAYSLSQGFLMILDIEKVLKV